MYAAFRPLGLKKGDINLMLRKDFATGTRPPFSPSLGAEYRFFKEKVKLFVNANRSYSLPTLNMKYWQPGGNPDLKPEKAWGGEMGLNFYHTKRNLIFETGTSVFAQMVNDWILWRPVSSTIWSPGNVKQVFARGLENHAFWEYKFEKLKFNVFLNQGITFSTNKKVYESAQELLVGNQLPYVPMHFGNVSISCEWKKFQLRIWETWAGKRFTSSDNLNSLGGYAVSDISLSRDFYFSQTRFGIEGRINNVLNQARALFPGRPLPGRSFFIRLIIEFTSPKK